VRSRRAAWIAAAIVVLAYVTGAFVSGRLSPFDGTPLLDGSAPPPPYRWVRPPAAVAASNQQPTPGSFTLGFDSRGRLKGAALATPDGQVTVIVPSGAIAASAGQRSVELTVDPLAPSAASSAPGSLVLLGNVVRVRATYRPGGGPARLVRPIEVVVSYPFVASDSGEHLLLESATGSIWTRVKATDHVGTAQLVGPMRSLGYVAAAGVRATRATSSPAGPASQGIPIAIVVVAAVLVLLIIVIVAGGRDGGRRPRR